jgi:TolA-binding protein
MRAPFWFRRPPLGEAKGPALKVFRELMDEYVHVHDRVNREQLFSKIEGRRGAQKRLLPVPGWQGRGLSRGPALVPALAVAAAAVALGVGFAPSAWFSAPASSAPLSYSATARDVSQAAPQEGEMRRWVSGQGPLLLAFSDQSQVRLGPETTLDVRILPSNRALFNLARGKVDVTVHHQDKTDYRFQAGGYEVRVTGTAFELGFEPGAEHVALHMREGRVELHTPEGGYQVVRGGESFEHSVPISGAPLAKQSEVASLEVGARRTETANGSALATNSRANGAEAAGVAGAKPSAASVSYVVLARDGKFAEIVEDALVQGLHSVLRSKSPAELLQLSHAARYGGHPDIARPVLQTLTQKYPRSVEGRAAHFFLGRVADAAGDRAAASAAYEQYLRHEPRGAYAPEALGRQMILAQHASLELSTKLARQYLARFPQGSYKTHAAALVKAAGLEERGSR